MPDESPVPAEILASAKDRLDDAELTLADNEEVLHALSELTLKREYEDEDYPLRWTQDGVFELFDSEDRLHRWRTEEELVEAGGELP